MTDIFISYSRKDSAFMRQLHDELSKNHKRDIWVDWEDIPLSANWWEEICDAIEAADAFAFIISPDSVNSEVCRKEIQHAVDNHKRILPILFRDIKEVDPTKVHPAIQAHNWIIYKEDVAQTAAQLVEARDLDLEYVQQHTRLLVRAKAWENAQRNRGLLLTSMEVLQYQKWVELSSTKQPRATQLQLEYVYTSETARDRRQRQFLVMTIVALVVMSGLIGFGLLQAQQASLAQLAVAQATGTNAAQEAIILAQKATAEAQQATLDALAVGQTQVAEDVANRVNNVNLTLTALVQPTIDNENLLRIQALEATLTAYVTPTPDLLNLTRVAELEVTLDALNMAIVTLAAQPTQSFEETRTALLGTQAALEIGQTEVAQLVLTVDTYVMGIGPSLELEDNNTPPIPEVVPTEEVEDATSTLSILIQTAAPTALPTATRTATPTLTATVTPTVTPTATTPPTAIPTMKPPTVTPPPTATIAPTATPITAIEGQWFVSGKGSDDQACYHPAVPCGTLAGALAKAQAGDTINLAPGVYNGGIKIEKSVIIVGENRDLTVLQKTTQEQNATYDIQSVFEIAPDTTVQIMNVTILGGNAAQDGGGILNYGDLTLVTVAVIGNIAPRYGGGIANYGTLDISNSSITDNIAPEYPAIYNADDTRFTIDRPSAWTYSEIPMGSPYVGGIGKITRKVTLRAGAGIDRRVLGDIPAETLVEIVAGPDADDWFRWWQIRTPEGEVGWIPESEDGELYFVTVDSIDTIDSRTDLLLVYDGDSFTLVNTAPAPLNLLNMTFEGAEANYRLSQFDSFVRGAGQSLVQFPPSACVEVWTNQGQQTPPITPVCPRRLAWATVRSDAAFWLTGSFEVTWNNRTVATCEASAGRCEIALPSR